MQNVSLIKSAPNIFDSLDTKNRDKQLLFFSGGSALNPLSQHLKLLTKKSVHLISPFDSGGSSGKLRRAFSIPAFGDLRSRITVLLDEQSESYLAVKCLFNYRFKQNLKVVDGLRELEGIMTGQHSVITDIAEPFRSYAQGALQRLVTNLPDDFDLSGANIGNLIFTGAYLENSNNLDVVLNDLERLLPVRGRVRFTANVDLQLKALLASGEEVVGQHLITGKEVDPLNKKICGLHLTSQSTTFQQTDCKLDAESKALIDTAGLICFPPGSFYSSLIANLLPAGVAKAIASSLAPKVYVPNLGIDPEQYGMSCQDCLETLVDTLARDVEAQASHLVTHILMHSDPGVYPGEFNLEYLTARGIKIIQQPLVTADCGPYYNPQLLAKVLFDLAIA